VRIVLGVSGGIAAYKAAELARALIRNGHEVQVVLTRSAEEFIRPLTFAALTGRKVITDLFSSTSPEDTLSSSVEHIGVAREHDLLLVAPATANVLAKFAHGLADDFLSTLYLAFRGPVVLAPAMNDNMWDHEATKANVETLRRRGHVIVDPGEGFLACGTQGAGRLADNDLIVEAVERTQNRGDLEGQTFLITAGPTQEPLDPVRYLSNRSSGKMGYALAEAALRRSAKVILISGPVAIAAPAGCHLFPVTTAQEMRDAVFAHLETATVIIKCAAVADYRPARQSPQKIKKTDAPVSLELERTPDILAELGQERGNRLLIGFAAETENLRDYASQKLASKNCDMIVANLVGQPDSGFESDSNEVLIALKSGEFIPTAKASKREVADKILNEVLKLIRCRLKK
jgi:phosphopantothenoylcysteine decarboxylase/phosphopantothenate--cysteine ligase